MGGIVAGIVKGLVAGLVAFWREWRARQDLKLLERTKAAYEGAKAAYRASEAARKAEREGEALIDRVDPERPDSPFIRLPGDDRTD